MRKLYLSVIVVVGMSLLWGCDQGITEPGSEEAATSEEASKTFTVIPGKRPESVDAQLSYLSEMVPGFAGVYLDGKEFVVLQAQGAEAGESLDQQAFLASVSAAAPSARRPGIEKIQRLMSEHPVRVRSVRYDYETLHAWVQEVFANVELPPSLNSFGISNRLNQITFDLHDAGDTTFVAEQMGKLGIPAEAYSFEITPEASLQAGRLANTTLRSSIDPVVGGIEVAGGGGGPCTMGFIIDAEFPPNTWNRSFLTADHCTDEMGQPLNDPTCTGVRGTLFFQGPGVGRAIGWEYYNGYRTHHGDSRCDNFDSRLDNDCYDADVALIKLDAGDKSHRGKIAKTGTPGNINWNTSNFYKVTDFEDSIPIEGTIVRKVGRTTGETYGTITHGCVLYNDPVAGRYFCSFRVARPSGVSFTISSNSDSGSPVFQVTSGTNVTAIGILIAGNGNDIFYGSSLVQALYTQGMPDYSYRFNYESSPR